MRQTSLLFIGMAILGLAVGASAAVPEDFAARIGSADVCTVDPTGATVDVAVNLDLAVGDVQGFSLGVCTVDESVAVATAAVEGASVGTAKAGNPADFIAANTVAGGATLGVVVDLLAKIKLDAQNDFEALVITYEVQDMSGLASDGGCAQVSTALELCDTLGAPPVASVAVVAGASISIGSPNSENGEITVGLVPPPICEPFVVSVEDVDVQVGATAATNVVLDFQDNSTGECTPDQLDYDIQGWSLGVCTGDPAVVEAVDAVSHPDVSTIGPGGGPPGFESVNVLPGEGVTQGIVVDLLAKVKLPAQNDFGALVITYEGVAALDCGLDPQATASSALVVCDTLGSPPVATVMVVEGGSIEPDIRVDGTATVGCAPAQNTFIRGEVNEDGRVDIADGVYLLNALFFASVYPDNVLNCLDAADANGDNVVDQSDAMYVFMYRFLDGMAPPAPFDTCGTDPDGGDGPLSDADGLSCENTTAPCE